MENLGLNNVITAGRRKFHVETSYSESTNLVSTKLFHEGQVISSKESEIGANATTELIKVRLNELHQELSSEIEILYYISQKVKAVRHADSANKLGLLFLQRNLLEEAIEQFHFAIDLNPDYFEVYANLGKAHLINESFEKATEVLKDGAKIAPEFADMQNYLGIAHLYQKNFPEAITHLQEAIRLNSNYIGAHLQLGIAYLALGFNGTDEQSVKETQSKALPHITTASERMVNRQIPKFERVVELVKRRAYKAAVDEFLLIKPKEIVTKILNIENEFYLKFMYGGKGKDDTFISEYVEKLSELIDEYPNYPDIRNYLGVANLIQCRNLFLKALEEFRAALKINPGFQKAVKNLKLAENDGKGFLILLRAILK